MEGHKFIAHVTFKITTGFFSTNKIQNTCIYLNHSYTHCSTSSNDCLLPTQLYYVKLWLGKIKSQGKWWHCQNTLKFQLSAIEVKKTKQKQTLLFCSIYIHIHFSMRDGTDGTYPPFQSYLKSWKSVTCLSSTWMLFDTVGKKTGCTRNRSNKRKFKGVNIRFFSQFCHSFFHTQNLNSNKCVG